MWFEEEWLAEGLLCTLLEATPLLEKLAYLSRVLEKWWSTPDYTNVQTWNTVTMNNMHMSYITSMYSSHVIHVFGSLGACNS